MISHTIEFENNIPDLQGFEGRMKVSFDVQIDERRIIHKGEFVRAEVLNLILTFSEANLPDEELEDILQFPGVTFYPPGRYWANPENAPSDFPVKMVAEKQILFFNPIFETGFILWGSLSFLHCMASKLIEDYSVDAIFEIINFRRTDEGRLSDDVATAKKVRELIMEKFKTTGKKDIMKTLISCSAGGAARGMGALL